MGIFRDGGQNYPHPAVRLDVPGKKFCEYLTVLTGKVGSPPGNYMCWWCNCCREPTGKYLVQVCTTTPCVLGGCGSAVILDALKQKLGMLFLLCTLIIPFSCCVINETNIRTIYVETTIYATCTC